MSMPDRIIFVLILLVTCANTCRIANNTEHMLEQDARPATHAHGDVR